MLRGLLVVTLLMVTETGATTYYVRSTGDDGNPGTSPSQAWKTISQAADTMTAGDTVYVGAGTYNEEVKPGTGGTQGNPIRYLADSSGALTGDAGTVAVTQSSKSAFNVSRDYIEVVGFRLFGSINGAAWTGGTGGLIESCELDGNSQQGGKVTGSSTQVTVLDCDFHDNTRNGLLLAVGPTVDLSRSSLRNNGNSGLDAGNSANTTLTVSACRIYSNNQDGIRLNMGTLTSTNCLVYDNATYGVRIAGPAAGTSVTIWNLTVASNGDYGLHQANGTLSVTNSILANNGAYGLSYTSGTITHTYNLIWGNTNGDYEGLSADPTEISGDPEFENIFLFDYHLTAASPAVDAGANAAGTIDDDLESTARPLANGWDLGCYESPHAAASGGGWRVLQWVEIDKPGP